METRLRRSKIFLIKNAVNKPEHQSDKIEKEADKKVKKIKFPVQNKHVEIF
jgi:hypothetical protein